MMQADDIRTQRMRAESDTKNVAYDDAAHLRLALWVIAEQLFELSHHLAAFREVIDPAAGERFPAHVRVRIHQQEEQ